MAVRPADILEKRFLLALAHERNISLDQGGLQRPFEEVLSISSAILFS